MTKKNQSKSNLHNCLIVELQQLHQLYNSSVIDFSLTFHVGLNALIYNASLTFLFFITFIITNENFKIIFPYVGVLTFKSVF